MGVSHHMSVCMRCRTANRPTASYCIRCGNRLTRLRGEPGGAQLGPTRRHQSFPGLLPPRGIDREDAIAKGIGCALGISGLALVTIGILLSLTVIGAIIGIPMALIGGFMFGYGFKTLLK